VLKFHAIEIAALERGAHASFLDAALGLQRGYTIGGKEQSAFFCFNDGVFEIRMKGEGAIVRNRPWRGGPDDGADIGSDLRGCASAADDSWELHPDGWAGVIFVFDFRFRKGRAVVNTPIDRLAPAVDVTLLHEIQERARNGGLVFMAHRQ